MEFVRLSWLFLFYKRVLLFILVWTSRFFVLDK